MIMQRRECSGSTGQIVYVDFEGKSAGNFNDIVTIYMVKYGVGDTATVMNDTSKSKGTGFVGGRGRVYKIFETGKIVINVLAYRFGNINQFIKNRL